MPNLSFKRRSLASTDCSRTDTITRTIYMNLLISRISKALWDSPIISGQEVPDINAVNLNPNYKSYTSRAINFDLSLPYAGYNWEVFFHAPFLIATQLSKGMRFEEAERWFHLIFDPTTSEGGDDATRYWGFLPFQRAGRGTPVEDLLKLLAKAASGQALTATEADLREEIKLQIQEMKAHPFQPHAIARGRLRAYQFVVVLKYLENLFAWADQLFRQDTIESINKATQLYVRAARILGNRPASIPPQPKPQAVSYRMLLGKWDEFSNAWLSLEGLIAPWIQFLQWLKEHGVVGQGGIAEIDAKIKQVDRAVALTGDALFLRATQRKVDRILGYSRGPAVQGSTLHEHRGCRATVAFI